MKVPGSPCVYLGSKLKKWWSQMGWCQYVGIPSKTYLKIKAASGIRKPFLNSEVYVFTPIVNLRHLVFKYSLYHLKPYFECSILEWLRHIAQCRKCIVYILNLVTFINVVHSNVMTVGFIYMPQKLIRALCFHERYHSDRPADWSSLIINGTHPDQTVAVQGSPIPSCKRTSILIWMDKL